MKLTYWQCVARAEAYEEAAGHLQLHWTDDKFELEQGELLSKRFNAQAKVWRGKAHQCPDRYVEQPPLAPRLRV